MIDALSVIMYTKWRELINFQIASQNTTDTYTSPVGESKLSKRLKFINIIHYENVEPIR